MAQIKLKRGLSTNVTSITLAAGEPAFCTDNGKLYIGKDGTSNKVCINPDVSETATQATKLATERNISLGGDVTGTTSFDGSADVTITSTLVNSGVTAGTHTKVTVNSKGLVTTGESLTVGDIPELTLSKISDAGTAASRNVGVGSGNIPVLDVDGKLAASTVPAIAISDTFVVNSQTAMLGINGADIGDVAVRTDINKCFILQTAGANVLGHWQELLTPDSPVQTVNGETGNVVISTSSIGLGNVSNTSDADKPVSTAQQTALDLKANISSPTFTGTPSAPTPATSDSSTRIATTAFVKAQEYLTAGSVIDGGSF